MCCASYTLLHHTYKLDVAMMLMGHFYIQHVDGHGLLITLMNNIPIL